MHLMRLLAIVMMAFVFSMCGGNRSSQVVQETSANRFDVIEVLHTSQYTYLQVLEKLDVKWVAIPKQDISVGDTYYYDNALEMNSFTSKELDRTFDVIYFVNQISKTPLDATHLGGVSPAHSGKVKTQEVSNINLPKADNEITVAQIFENSETFSGKETEIRGIVVKINEGVMGTNWVHIQDGTSGNGNFDLTITSQDLPVLNEEATFKGSITLKKDFGAGYFYEVIMENAQLVKVN
jgi:hypothetical protein